MNGLSAAAAEFSARIRRGAELGLLLLENRLELVSLELREEKIELVRVFVRALLAVQLGLLTLVLACISAVLLTPEHMRAEVLLAITVVVFLLALLAVLLLMRSARRLGKPLARTIAELRRDREML